MPTVAQINHLRQRRRLLATRKPGGKIGLGCSGMLSVLIAFASILLAFSYASLTHDLPPVDLLPALLEPPDGLLRQPTRLYDQSGEHILLTLENPATAGSQYLWLDPASAPDGQVFSTALITATVAAADVSFWRHPGFSLSGIFQGSHPTLAQRLASDLLLNDEPTSLRRSLRERLLAAQLTSRYGRQKILEWYLNSASYGHLAYGADAAARLYLGKPATQLSLAEAAMLAAVGEAPALNPQDNLLAALERQKYLIQDMLEVRLITPEEGMQAVQEPLRLRPLDSSALISADQPLIAPAFTNLVLAQLEAHIPRSRLERGGLKITTTLDYDLQLQTACTVRLQLARLGSVQAEAACEAARLLPTLPVQTALPPESLHADAVILEPATGRILVLATEPSTSPDAVLLPGRPLGSLSTPFVYLTAFTRGFSPASLVWDIPLETLPPDLLEFNPSFNGPVRLRQALANDYLVPAQVILSEIGPENVLHTVHQLGLITPDSAVQPDAEPALESPFILSLFPEIDLLRVSQVFGIFANQGTLAGRAIDAHAQAGLASPIQGYQPSPLGLVAVLRVEDHAGEILLDWSDSQSRPIITPQLAYLMNNVLSDETARWPSLGHPNPLEIGLPVAAKIGRTSDGESNWTIGYTPQRVIGVWLGLASQPAPLQGELTQLLPNAAASLWHALIQYTARELPYQSWSVPSGISRMQVCDPSGMLPTPACPNTVEEVFLSGSEPSYNDTLYQAIQVNRQTGHLATIFTPPDLVDSRIFMQVPPEAEAWARSSALPAPPQDYDVLPLDLPSWPDAAITGPAMFAPVRSEVPILGTAGGENFAYFRLQVGPGLNPQSWYLVGQDVSAPVSNGQLGVWDTRGLNGLYALQLMVVQQDQSVHRATVLVSVDNQPPEVQITYPGNQTEITVSAEKIIILQADVQDDLGLQTVAFYVDGALLTTFTQPPFAATWTARPGRHTLRVLATDLAGNTGEATITFSIQ